MRTLVALLCAAAALGAQPARPAPAGARPAPPEPRVERLGELVPRELPFREADGRAVTLGELHPGRPAVLALVWFRCPMLCQLVQEGLVAGLKALPFTPGREFEVLVLSFDPAETPELAAERRAAALARYARPGSEAGWHFLTGAAEPIGRVLDAVGFDAVRDQRTGQFAHAAGLVVLTPEGRISRVLFGLDYAPRDLRLALVEAGEGRVGSLVDRVLLLCWRWDPATGKYTAAVLGAVRIGGVATLLALVLALRRWRRPRAEGC
jgi:protein SCO1/2